MTIETFAPLASGVERSLECAVDFDREGVLSETCPDRRREVPSGRARGQRARAAVRQQYVRFPTSSPFVAYSVMPSNAAAGATLTPACAASSIARSARGRVEVLVECGAHVT